MSGDPLAIQFKCHPKAQRTPREIIERSIFLIRGQRVMLDRDLAYLYGVPTKVLNQAVKRHGRRFPSDFMFRLTEEEKNELVTNCDRLERLKHSSALPSVFTEQGVAMLSSVLNSERAIEVNILIMRAFVRLREVMASSKEFARRLEELERRIASHMVRKDLSKNLAQYLKLPVSINLMKEMKAV